MADRTNERDIPLSGFVEEALREKLEKIATGKDGGWGPLADLESTDRARVLKFIACLRAAPKNRGFRKAVDANFAWLMETITPK
jgi:hypothetical protein